MIPACSTGSASGEGNNSRHLAQQPPAPTAELWGEQGRGEQQRLEPSAVANESGSPPSTAEPRGGQRRGEQRRLESSAVANEFGSDPGTAEPWGGERRPDLDSRQCRAD